MSQPAIELRGLSRRYDDLWAVRDLTLTVNAGDTYGFIGPNGAGKTTTIRMLATLLSPTAGEARICGMDPTAEPEAVRRVIGYMPDHFGIYDDLRVWEYLDFFAAAYRIPARRRPGIIDGVLELTDLGAKRDALVDSLSKGMQQRLCLAKTLVHDPQVLLLDEPASGLDPRARVELRELLRELARMGKTVFVSSHILAELAEMCNRVGILERGRLVAEGSVDELSARLAPRALLRLEVLGPSEAASRLVAAVGGLTVEGTGERHVTVRFDGPEAELPALIGRVLAAGVPLVGFTRERTGLESIFLQMTKGAVA